MPEDAQDVMARIARMYAHADRVRARVRELSDRLSASGPLVCVARLRGGVPFLADLVRELGPGVEVDFVQLSTFASHGPPRFLKDLDVQIRGRRVLVVEDVVDTGLSVEFLVNALRSREPEDVRVCTLIDRPSKRLSAIEPDLTGFQVADEYLVGYGLELYGRYGNLPCLVEIEDLGAASADPGALLEPLRRWGVW